MCDFVRFGLNYELLFGAATILISISYLMNITGEIPNLFIQYSRKFQYGAFNRVL